MEQRHPVTAEQQELLKLDLIELKEKLGNVIDSIRTCHGEESVVYSRAQEIAGALQRLEWARGRDLMPGHAEMSGRNGILAEIRAKDSGANPNHPEADSARIYTVSDHLRSISGHEFAPSRHTGTRGEKGRQ